MRAHPVYHSFYYVENSVARAGTIVHETRHADGMLQGPNTCPRQASCDPNWSTGGANTYQLMWLAAFYWQGQLGYNDFVTVDKRSAAQDRFNSIKMTGFSTPVLWDLNNLYLINIIPDWYMYTARCSEDPANPTPCF